MNYEEEVKTILLEKEKAEQEWINQKLVQLCKNKNDKTASIKYMLSLKADIHCYNEEPLFSAINYGSFENIKIVVSSNADINFNHGNPLRLACTFAKRKLNVVKLLVENKADISYCNYHCVRTSHSLEILKYLVEKKPDSLQYLDKWRKNVYLQFKYFRKWRKIVFKSFIRKVVIPLYYSPRFVTMEKI